MRIANPAERLTDIRLPQNQIREQDAHLAHGFFFPLPFHFFTKITRIVKIETLC